MSEKMVTGKIGENIFNLTIIKSKNSIHSLPYTLAEVLLVLLLYLGLFPSQML